MTIPDENIDLVAVLPTGVFIVEVKHWSGRVTLKDDVMFHGGKQPRRVHAQVERQRRKLHEQLELPIETRGVIVLVPKGDLTITGEPGEHTTPVIHEWHLPTFLTQTADGPRPVVLRDYEIAGIAALIRHGAPVRMRLLDEHTAPPPPEEAPPTAHVAALRSSSDGASADRSSAAPRSRPAGASGTSPRPELANNSLTSGPEAGCRPVRAVPRRFANALLSGTA